MQKPNNGSPASVAAAAQTLVTMNHSPLRTRNQNTNSNIDETDQTDNQTTNHPQYIAPGCISSDSPQICCCAAGAYCNAWQGGPADANRKCSFCNKLVHGKSCAKIFKDGKVQCYHCRLSFIPGDETQECPKKFMASFASWVENMNHQQTNKGRLFSYKDALEFVYGHPLGGQWPQISEQQQTYVQATTAIAATPINGSQSDANSEQPVQDIVYTQGNQNPRAGIQVRSIVKFG